MSVPARKTLRQRLAKDDTLGAVWLSLGSVALCEIAKRSRPDVIVIDMQHGLWDRLTLEAAIGTAPCDVPVLVRVADNTPAAIGQALDAGAEGVIVPLVETADEARAAVAAAHYPPKGKRSGGGIRPLANFAEYVAAAGDTVLVAAMIETKQGLRNAAAIAKVNGVDLVFIGTGDLALSIGAFPDDTQRTEAACDRILAACKAAGTHCGTFTHSLEAARAKRGQGYRLVVTENDIALATRGFGDAAGFGRPDPAPLLSAAAQRAGPPGKRR